MKTLAYLAWFAGACALALAQDNSRPAAQAASGTISSGPFKLRYVVEGSGPPAIVVGSALYYQRAFSTNLRRHLRLVFVDHRGFAPSPGKVDVSEFALEKVLDDVEHVRQQLGLGRVVIIGHSGHGFMALEYAKKHPAHVSHVVMIGIGPDISEASKAAAERSWAESVSPERKAALAENLRRITDDDLAKLSPEQRNVRTYVRNGPKIWFDPRFDSSPLWEGVELNVQMYNHVWGEVFRDIDITQGLATFDRPVFLALGRYDFIVPPPASWDPLRPKFRDLTIRVFERSGHTPQLEEPALFDEELLRWMKEKARDRDSNVTAASKPATWNDPSPHVSRFVTVNGVSLHTLDWGGKGEPLVLIPGSRDNPHVFDGIAPQLTDRFRVVGYARRDNGRSERKGPYSVDTLV